MLENHLSNELHQTSSSIYHKEPNMVPMMPKMIQYQKNSALYFSRFMSSSTCVFFVADGLK